jgi:trans-aconitate methyltransferase
MEKPGMRPSEVPWGALLLPGYIFSSIFSMLWHDAQMPDSSENLAAISAATLDHYESHAQGYWEGTRDHDVQQNIDALLAHIEGAPPYTILDFGCGPGRDLITLAALGHQPIGLDGAAAFAEMAHAHSGCTVWHQDFLALDLPPNRFDGIFANASLQHIPKTELPRVLRDLHGTLKPRGVLFASIPHGDDQEGGNDARYSCFHRPASWHAQLQSAGFAECLTYYRPVGLPRS